MTNMIDIYKYKDAEKLKIIDIDNKTYIGYLVTINDVEDEDEDYGLKENSITLGIQKRPVTFPVSEIKSIEILE